jgi:hypothetical protein
MRSTIIAFTVLNLGIHLNAGVVFQFDAMYGLLVLIYQAPWLRIVPYIMGTFTAVNLYENLKTTKVSNAFLNFFYQHIFCF